jgi:hypothetical protein
VQVRAHSQLDFKLSADFSQAVRVSLIDSLVITWTDSLNWEVTIDDDDSRKFCGEFLRACPPAVKQMSNNAL